jgi:hypothetical protein
MRKIQSQLSKPYRHSNNRGISERLVTGYPEILYGYVLERSQLNGIMEDV